MRSIHVGGDLRVVYKILNSDTVYFITLGTHSELYS
jgi:addiction module RelE/StbE family toxin